MIPRQQNLHHDTRRQFFRKLPHPVADQPDQERVIARPLQDLAGGVGSLRESFEF
jgi:hypothetical protein